MKILKPQENKYFNIEYDNQLYNWKTEQCFGPVDKTAFLPYEGCPQKREDLKFYASGAVRIIQEPRKTKFKFITNSGDYLVNVEFEKTTSPEFLVCSSGVLIGKTLNKNSWRYFLYNGTLIEDNSFDSIINKINQYDETAGFYADGENVREKKSENPYTNFLMSCLDSEQGM